MTRPPPATVRRREQLVGAIIVVVGIAVATLAFIALRAAGDRTGSGTPVAVATRPSASSPGPTGAPTSTSTSSATSTAPSASTTIRTPAPSATSAATVPLVVLNNSTRSGLAEQAAATFVAGGWTVTSTGNLAGNIVSTCAYYDPSVTGAQAAATRLMGQFPAIQRVKEKFGALPSGPIVVVLTRDYTST